MQDTKKIKTALVSVFHKDGLDELLAELHAQGVQFLSTGGTQSFIESLGYPCQKVEDVTTYPSILGGRVKTLHPKVFGGILGRRGLESDREQMAKYEKQLEESEQRLANLQMQIMDPALASDYTKLMELEEQKQKEEQNQESLLERMLETETELEEMQEKG